jgi:hypothetical protein
MYFANMIKRINNCLLKKNTHEQTGASVEWTASPKRFLGE